MLLLALDALDALLALDALFALFALDALLALFALDAFEVLFFAIFNSLLFEKSVVAMFCIKHCNDSIAQKAFFILENSGNHSGMFAHLPGHADRSFFSYALR